MPKKISGYTKPQLLDLPPDVLRALIREKAHFSVEFPVYQALYSGGGLPPNLGQSLRELLNVWKQRDLPVDADDIEWCNALLALAEKVQAGKRPNVIGEPAKAFSNIEQQVVDRLIHTRRSVRFWEDKPVAPELIDAIMEAALWAPHSCNLQTIRFVVMRGEDGRDLFGPRKITLRHWPVRILVAQDMDVYDCIPGDSPTFNRDLDCGAAVQNMLLYAHSLGLGAVWTSLLHDEAQQLHAHFDLPDYIRIRTCVTVGWPAQHPLPPGRIHLEDAVLLRTI